MFQLPLPLLANLFVMAFAIDAGVSLLEEILRSTTGSAALFSLRQVIAALVFFASIPYLIAIALTPRLPAAVFVPLALSALWLNLGAAPLPILIDSSQSLAFTADVLQGVVAGWALFSIRRRTGGSWLFTSESLRGPAFRARHTLASLAVGAFVLAPAAGLYSLVYLATAIQQSTSGFIVFDLDGVSLSDRRFRQQGREIQLVGMMHIGEESAYAELFRSFATESTVVLTEGVTDDLNLMQTHLSYAGAATSLGLAPQLDIEDYLDAARADESIPAEWPHIRHADVDVSSFSPTTLAFLESAARLWNSEDLPAALRQLSKDPVLAAPDLLQNLQYELIDHRNEQLLAQLFDAIDQYQRVVVPWGALHLPAIEAEVIDRGYTLETSEEHPLISWSALLAALL